MNAYASLDKNLSQRWIQNSSNLFMIVWSVAIITGLGIGWLAKDEGYLSPDSGLGYWLGIIGCSSMLLLLTYSLRKRFRFMRKALPIKRWFQLHMALGIIGPLCIVFHSNFHLGSLNSIVALVCMLLVAGSGLIGRYIYNRIHFGLYGERIRLQQALIDVKSLFADLSALASTPKQTAYCDQMRAAIEQLVYAQENNSLNFGQRRKLAKNIGKQLRAFTKTLDRNNRQQETTTLADVHNKLQRDYITLEAMLKKIPGLAVFEKMFSIWHVVHIPIFFMMIGSAIVHVIVVHMY